MRIGLDARILAGPKSGISTYLINLLNSFSKSPELEIFLFTDKAIKDEYLSSIASAKLITFAKANRKCWAQFYLPAQLKKYNIQLYHAVWNNAVPIFTDCPTVLTIHDLAPWDMPEYFTKLKKKIRYKLQTYICACRANKIITDSEYSKQRIVANLKVPAEKIKVIHLGVEDVYSQCASSEAIANRLKQYNINKDYFIDYGDFGQPRKNIELLVRTFAEFIRKYNLDMQLVVAGPKYSNSGCQRLLQIVKDLQMQERIIFPGHMSTRDLAIVLSAAKALVLPSIYEGFGLPVLEAMSAGVAVVAGGVTSVPEIAAQAALLINPYSQEELLESMARIYFDRDLRANLIAQGRERIKSFSWTKTSEQTLQVYRELLNNKP